MPAKICLADGHSVDTLLFNSVCNKLREIAALHKIVLKIPGEKDNKLTGLVVIRELYLKSIYYRNYGMSFESSLILLSYNIFGNDGGIKENVRNIILSLCKIDEGRIYMTIPAPVDKDDSALAEEVLDLGPVFNLPQNKSPR